MLHCSYGIYSTSIRYSNQNTCGHLCTVPTYLQTMVPLVRYDRYYVTEREFSGGRICVLIHGARKRVHVHGDRCGGRHPTFTPADACASQLTSCRIIRSSGSRGLHIAHDWKDGVGVGTFAHRKCFFSHNIRTTPGAAPPLPAPTNSSIRRCLYLCPNHVSTSAVLLPHVPRLPKSFQRRCLRPQ